MSNRLQKEKSPYLRQHSENPVDWYPWGEEAFRKAREEDATWEELEAAVKELLNKDL